MKGTVVLLILSLVLMVGCSDGAEAGANTKIDEESKAQAAQNVNPEDQKAIADAMSNSVSDETR